MGPDPVWGLTAEWWDGDALHYGHAYFSTKRDAEAVGRRLAVAHGGEGTDFQYSVVKIGPWPSSTREVPFGYAPTIDQMVKSTEKEWDL